MDPVPLTDMGRFNHEAVAVDPKSGCVYLTEDRHDGLFYRFIPNTPGDMKQGGRLQALCFKDRPSADSRNWDEDVPVKTGENISVEWIDMADPLSPEDDMRFVGFDAGAARFARGEGMWYGNGSIYFACTNGGPIKKGQIWRYFPSEGEGTDAERVSPAYLQLSIESRSAGILDNADNITVSPWGDLVVCEDGSGEQFLVGITPDGKIYKFARNATARNSEFAGATFSPDGTTFFYAWDRPPTSRFTTVGQPSRRTRSDERHAGTPIPRKATLWSATGPVAMPLKCGSLLPRLLRELAPGGMG